MNDKAKKELYKILASIDNTSDLQAVFSDLLTPGELEDIVLRYQIYQQLLAGKTQRDIAKSLDVSLATVSRGSLELKRGKGGIKKVLAL